jgi:hypothetical protein
MKMYFVQIRDFIIIRNKLVKLIVDLLNFNLQLRIVSFLAFDFLLGIFLHKNFFGIIPRVYYIVYSRRLSEPLNHLQLSFFFA